MPTADERMMTTDPAPGKPGWLPKTRGRYPTVKIKKGWEPRSQVGMGQSVGVGARSMIPVEPGQQPFDPNDPFAGATGSLTATPPTTTSPSGYAPSGGGTSPTGSQVGATPGTSNPPNIGGTGVAGTDTYVPVAGANNPGGVSPSSPQGVYAPQGGGPSQQGGGGGGPAAQGGGGGAQAARGPTPQEMEAVARYAASQWGVSYEEAMAEIMGGGPNAAEAQNYLRAALGMLRGGAPEIMAFMGGGMQDQAQVDMGGGAPPPSAPPTGGTPPPTQGTPGGQGPGGAESQFQKDSRFRDFYQQNDVMHAAQGLAKQYGAPSDAIDMGDGTTTVKFAGGHSIRMNPDGTIYNGAAPGAPPAGGGQQSAKMSSGGPDSGGSSGGGRGARSAWRAPGGR